MSIPATDRSGDGMASRMKKTLGLAINTEINPVPEADAEACSSAGAAEPVCFATSHNDWADIMATVSVTRHLVVDLEA